MNIKPVINEFISSTNISDEKYLSIFSLLADKLSKFGKIKWKRFVIVFLDQNNVLRYNLSDKQRFPFYLMEVIVNVFESEYCCIPKNIEIKIFIEYDGVEYCVHVQNGRVHIPEELSFIKKYNFHKLFIVPLYVYDVFYEYDYFFRNLIFEHKQLPETVNSVFQYTDIKLGSENSVEDLSIDETRLAIEVIRQKIQEILAKLEDLTKERDQLLESEKTIRSALSSRESLQMEKTVLDNQLNSILESKTYLDSKLTSLEEQLQAIELELISAVDSKNESYAEFLREKKRLALSEKESLENSRKDINRLYDNTMVRLNQIKDQLLIIDKYNEHDLDIIVKKVASVDVEYDNLYSAMSSLELQLKSYQDKVANQELSKALPISDINDTHFGKIFVNYCKSGGYTDQHLFVYNYLKYYYSYHVTDIATRELPNLFSFPSEVLYSLATRIFFAKKFGLVFNTVFSPYQFTYRNMENIIHMVNE